MLDSSFLVAYLNEGDTHHRAAAGAMARLLKGQWGAAILPEYVFLETVTVLASRVDLGFAQEEGRKLLSSRDAELVACSPYFSAAFEVFRTQRETELSFVDSAIVAIVRDRGATYVATFDRDFKKVDGISVVPA